LTTKKSTCTARPLSGLRWMLLMIVLLAGDLPSTVTLTMLVRPASR